MSSLFLCSGPCGQRREAWWFTRLDDEPGHDGDAKHSFRGDRYSNRCRECQCRIAMFGTVYLIGCRHCPELHYVGCAAYSLEARMERHWFSALYCGTTSPLYRLMRTYPNREDWVIYPLQENVPIAELEATETCWALYLSADDDTPAHHLPALNGKIPTVPRCMCDYDPSYGFRVYPELPSPYAHSVYQWRKDVKTMTAAQLLKRLEPPVDV